MTLGQGREDGLDLRRAVEAIEGGDVRVLLATEEQESG